MDTYDIILGCVGLCIAVASLGMITFGVAGVLPPMALALMMICVGLFVWSPVEKEDLSDLLV